MTLINLYVSIGNSDNKLTQKQWNRFCAEVDALVTSQAQEVHGRWYSLPNSEYQNACWSCELDAWGLSSLKNSLKATALLYEQDSIAVTEGYTKFIKP